MKQFEDDNVPYKKKANRKTPKKSNHKHQYELTEKEEYGIGSCFDYKYVCKVCGKAIYKFEFELD